MVLVEWQRFAWIEKDCKKILLGHGRTIRPQLIKTKSFDPGFTFLGLDRKVRSVRKPGALARGQCKDLLHCQVDFKRVGRTFVNAGEFHPFSIPKISFEGLRQHIRCPFEARKFYF